MGFRFGGGPPPGGDRGAQRAASLHERRKRGTRIKEGLSSLHDLDAQQTGTNRHRRQREPDDAPAIPQPVAPPIAALMGVVPQTVFDVDWSDWVAVKQKLFPSPTAEPNPSNSGLQEALETMRRWSQRGRSGQGRAVLPGYIEATMLLTISQELDRSSQCTSAISCAALRASYGHAIGRAVHLMTGSLIKSRSFVSESTTYRQRAQSSGFPEEAVEVRQRIAHGAEPLLSELRWVAAMILQHLFHVYWVVQAGQVQHLKAELRQEHQAAERANAKRLRKEERAARRSVSLNDMEALLAAADEAAAIKENDDVHDSPLERQQQQVFFDCCTFVEGGCGKVA